MTVNVKLNFPVLRIHNEFVSGGHGRSERNFGYSGAFVLEEWTDHSHHHLLDASGNLYKVNSIQESEWKSLSVRKKFLLKIRNLTAPLLYLRRDAPKVVWVDYDLSFVRNMNLAEAKDFVASEVLRVNPRWKPNGPSIREFKEIREKYSTMSELTGSSISEGG